MILTDEWFIIDGKWRHLFKVHEDDKIISYTDGKKESIVITVTYEPNKPSELVGS